MGDSLTRTHVLCVDVQCLNYQATAAPCEKNEFFSHRLYKVHCMGAHRLLRQQIRTLTRWLAQLTAGTSNRLGQYASSAGSRDAVKQNSQLLVLQQSL